MAREDITKQIDNETYQFKALPATKSLKLAIKIIKLLGLPLSVTLDAVTSGSGKEKKEVAKQLNYMLDFGKEIDFSKIGKAIVERLDSDEEQIEVIIKLALSSTFHHGSGMLSSDGTFNVHFGGRLAHMLKVFIAALEAEYQDFFELIRMKSDEGLAMLNRLNQDQESNIELPKGEN